MNYLYLYGAIIIAVIVLYSRRHVKKVETSTTQLKQSVQSGMAEPPSLHPIFDPVRCIGSGSCATVCPEGAIGIVKGKGVLINASACIGHGACLAACPFDAIKLVFGTEKRGIDIPNISRDFETNVPGIFIAGELGGMGLIRKAVEQGRQAIQAVRKRGSAVAAYDVVIVGAGPAGLSAGLSSMHHKLNYKLVEQEESLGGAVYHYPRQKIAMTAALELDMVGRVDLGEVSKEKLLGFWQGVVEKTGLEIGFRERMESIEKTEDGFVVKTNKGGYVTKSVLLTMGRRGTPRKLGVPGEEAAKVVYRLVDAEQYKGQSVLVVGGGDSALEAAVALSEQPGTQVILSYRSEAFSRVKPKNSGLLDAAQKAGRIQVMLNSGVLEIRAKDVVIEANSQIKAYKNDAVIVCAGGLLPTPLLQKIGIRFESKFGTA